VLEPSGPVSEAKIWDLCVVGTGPVGMAIALELEPELEKRGQNVLLLESGDAGSGPASSAASNAEIVDPRRHAPMEIAVCRALGGTSWTWGGRCVPFDDVDFLERPFVPDARWPLTHSEIRPWYARAAEYLLCGSDTFALEYERPLTHGLNLDLVERWARTSRVILAHRQRLLASQRIRICLNSTVTAVNLTPDGMRVESLTVATPQGSSTVRARRFVLAMGGVEVTRLLLATQQRWPEHFGGIGGPLGRYYMGHLSGKIADIVFDEPGAVADLDFKLDRTGSWIRRRFALDDATQLRHELLNTVFWPDNAPFYDAAHRSGVLSGVFLALTIPPVGRKLVSEGIRLAHTGPRPYPLAAHVKNAVLGAPASAADIYRILRDRFVRKPKKPGFLVRNRAGRYALNYHAEQIPNPESRITLSEQTDAFGVPRAVLDLRFVPQDIESVLASHRLLDTALRANSIGRLEYRYPEEDLFARADAQASDGYHQVGTTRMGDDPRSSVVDSDLKVHGLENLYVASSSVFPTTGQANSTFLAVALACRLTEKLALPDGPAARPFGGTGC
jgi:choline dehydrogenase-like flavoprotein